VDSYLQKKRKQVRERVCAKKGKVYPLLKEKREEMHEFIEE